MQTGDEALLSIILAGQGILVKMLITLEPQMLVSINFCIHYTFLKLPGKMSKKRKNLIKKKYWSRLESNHCASGCWIERKPLKSLSHHVLYTYLHTLYLCLLVRGPGVNEALPGDYCPIFPLK